MLPREKIFIQQGLVTKNEKLHTQNILQKTTSLVKNYLPHRKLKINTETDV